MDIRCPQCGDPIGMDALHDVDGMDFEQAWAAFRRDGCKALGHSHAKTTASPAIAMLMDLLGDDVDGFACMVDDMEDFGFDIYE